MNTASAQSFREIAREHCLSHNWQALVTPNREQTARLSQPPRQRLSTAMGGYPVERFPEVAPLIREAIATNVGPPEK